MYVQMKVFFFSQMFKNFSKIPHENNILYELYIMRICTISSKRNGTPNGVYLIAHFEATFDFSHSEFPLK